MIGPKTQVTHLSAVIVVLSFSNKRTDRTEQAREKYWPIGAKIISMC